MQSPQFSAVCSPKVMFRGTEVDIRCLPRSEGRSRRMSCATIIRLDHRPPWSWRRRALRTFPLALRGNASTITAIGAACNTSTVPRDHCRGRVRPGHRHLHRAGRPSVHPVGPGSKRARGENLADDAASPEQLSTRRAAECRVCSTVGRQLRCRFRRARRDSTVDHGRVAQPSFNVTLSSGRP
jgi:hypothetical protein